jgi:hypothetical protein
MPIESSQVVDVLKGVLQPTIRVVDRFVSRARLYRPHPIDEILREWEVVESVLISVFGLPFRSEGKLQTTQALCIGGRLGTLRIGDCIPYQSIESGSELVRELAEFEGKLIDSNTLDGLGTQLDSEFPPPGIFIVTNEGSLSFSLKQGSKFRLEDLSMQARSLKPAPTVFESSS